MIGVYLEVRMGDNNKALQQQQWVEDVCFEFTTRPKVLFVTHALLARALAEFEIFFGSKFNARVHRLSP